MITDNKSFMAAMVSGFDDNDNDADHILNVCIISSLILIFPSLNIL